MPNELQFIFSREDMQKLLDSNTDLIVITSHLEEAVLQDGSKAGIVKVRAEAVNKGVANAIQTVEGCPIPPCKT